MINDKYVGFCCDKENTSCKYNDKIAFSIIDGKIIIISDFSSENSLFSEEDYDMPDRKSFSVFAAAINDFNIAKLEIFFKNNAEYLDRTQIDEKDIKIIESYGIFVEKSLEEPVEPEFTGTALRDNGTIKSIFKSEKKLNNYSERFFEYGEDGNCISKSTFSYYKYKEESSIINKCKTDYFQEIYPDNSQYKFYSHISVTTSDNKARTIEISRYYLKDDNIVSEKEALANCPEIDLRVEKNNPVLLKLFDKGLINISEMDNNKLIEIEQGNTIRKIISTSYDEKNAGNYVLYNYTAEGKIQERLRYEGNEVVEKEGGEVIDKNSAEYVYANFLITNHSIEEAREIAKERGLGAIINAIEQIEAKQEEIKALNGGAIGAE